MLIEGVGDKEESLEFGPCSPLVYEAAGQGFPEEEGTSDGLNLAVDVSTKTGPAVLVDTGARYVDRYVMHQDT